MNFLKITLNIFYAIKLFTTSANKAAAININITPQPRLSQAKR